MQYWRNDNYGGWIDNRKKKEWIISVQYSTSISMESVVEELLELHMHTSVKY